MNTIFNYISSFFNGENKSDSFTPISTPIKTLRPNTQNQIGIKYVKVQLPRDVKEQLYNMDSDTSSEINPISLPISLKYQSKENNYNINTTTTISESNQSETSPFISSEMYNYLVNKNQLGDTIQKGGASKLDESSTSSTSESSENIMTDCKTCGNKKKKDTKEVLRAKIAKPEQKAGKPTKPKPKSTKPKPTKPKSTKPKPTKPKSTKPKPTKPTKPKPTSDSNQISDENEDTDGDKDIEESDGTNRNESIDESKGTNRNDGTDESEDTDRDKDIEESDGTDESEDTDEDKDIEESEVSADDEANTFQSKQNSSKYRKNYTGNNSDVLSYISSPSNSNNNNSSELSGGSISNNNDYVPPSSINTTDINMVSES